MATLLRDVERPSFLERPPEGQLSLGEVGAPAGGCELARDPKPGRESLSERLGAERLAEAAAAGTAVVQIAVPRGGEATLDELLVGAWEGLSARRPVDCPVCRARMDPHAGAAGGACGGCGSRLR